MNDRQVKTPLPTAQLNEEEWLEIVAFVIVHAGNGRRYAFKYSWI
jgi:hypothetical protein